MTDVDSTPLLDLDEDAALRMILEGTETGERFLFALVENLAKALRTHGAMVTQRLPDKKQLKTLAFWMDGDWVLDYVFDIPGTPFEQAIDQKRLIHFPERLNPSTLNSKNENFGSQAAQMKLMHDAC